MTTKSQLKSKKHQNFWSINFFSRKCQNIARALSKNRSSTHVLTRNGLQLILSDNFGKEQKTILIELKSIYFIDECSFKNQLQSILN